MDLSHSSSPPLAVRTPAPSPTEQREAPAYGALREGAPLIVAIALLGVLVFRINRPAGLVLLGIAAWSAWFFRDPVRHCPSDPDVLYAAADGRVMAVHEVDWDWHIHGRALRIVTFLSPLDVHVNRCPTTARLVASRRDPGSFMPAFLRGGSEGNARQLLALELTSPPAAPPPLHKVERGTGGAVNSETNRLVVAQIVGVVARRIISWRWPGDSLLAGEKLGMIRFGSRTDVLVPAGIAQALVSPGDTVRAGQTPIARYTGRGTAPQ